MEFLSNMIKCINLVTWGTKSRSVLS